MFEAFVVFLVENYSTIAPHCDKSFALGSSSSAYFVTKVSK